MTSVAIVYDRFLVQGGGERVCEVLLEAFPDANIYALTAKPRDFWERKLNKRVISPPLGGIITNRSLSFALYPLSVFLMSLVRVKADVVISYASTCGKYVRPDCSWSILYSNFPNRGFYQPERLIESRLVRALISPFIKLMKLIEIAQIRKYDEVYSISNVARLAMLEFAGVDSKILHAPFTERGIMTAVDAENIDGGDYFVMVSRLEPQKELDYVIEAFRDGTRRLKVIGTGTALSDLKRRASENVEFLGFLEDAEMGRYLRHAKALIFPSEIEWSLVPLEAIFLGTPVISFDGPSMREQLIDAASGRLDANSVFYAEKTFDALDHAIQAFGEVQWDKEAIKRSALPFGRAAFIDRIREIVSGLAVTTTRRVEA